MNHRIIDDRMEKYSSLFQVIHLHLKVALPRHIEESSTVARSQGDFSVISSKKFRNWVKNVATDFWFKIRVKNACFG